MAKVIHKIKVEVAKPNFFQAIVAKQFDKGSRFLNVTFVDEGEKIEIAKGSTVTINATRSDGGEKKFAGSVNSDGTATVPLTYWMLELEGKVKIDISVTDTSGSTLTSTSFNIEVEKASCGDSGVSEDDEEVDVLISLIKEVQNVKENYNVEQTYNPTSTKAQSGIAVAQAVEQALENFEGGNGSENINEEVKLKDATTGTIYALLVENGKLVLKNLGTDTPDEPDEPDTPDVPDVPDTPVDPDVVTEPYDTQKGIWGVGGARSHISISANSDYYQYSAIDKLFRITDYPAVFNVGSSYAVNGATYTEDGTFIQFVSNLTDKLEITDTNAKWIGVNIRIPDDDTPITEPFGLDECEFTYSNAEPLTIYSDFSSAIHNAVWNNGYFDQNDGVTIKNSAKCIYCEDYIDISSQDSISFSCPDGYIMRLFVYDENKQIVPNSILLRTEQATDTMKSTTIIPSSSAKYIRMHIETTTSSSISIDEKLNIEAKSFTY